MKKIIMVMGMFPVFIVLTVLLGFVFGVEWFVLDTIAKEVVIIIGISPSPENVGFIAMIISIINARAVCFPIVIGIIWQLELVARVGSFIESKL